MVYAIICASVVMGVLSGVSCLFIMAAVEMMDKRERRRRDEKVS